MGYKDELFEEQVDDELKCPICEKVLEAPVQGDCEHLFCSDCIQLWLKNSLVCPLDRRQLLPSQLQPPPRIILKLLNNLKIRCSYHDYGCLVKLKLVELKQHARICLHNPGLSQNAQKAKKVEFKNSFNKSNSTSNQINQIKRFRVAGDMSNEINEIDRIVRDLNQDLDYEHRKSVEFAQNLEIAQLNYDHLNSKFKKIVNPFLNLLKSGYESNARLTEAAELEKEKAEQNLSKQKQLIDEQELNSNSIIAEERQTCTAIIRNLNEFLNEQVVEEYLRQNDIPTLSCELELNISRVRSRDFKVVFYRNDFHKLFSENLWPTGVTLHSLSSNRDNQIIFGKRQSDLPCLFIKSGLALSYY